MKEFRYTITDPEGIHARPAGMLVKEAGKYESKLTIAKGDKSGDLKRIFAVMGLGVKNGEEVLVTADGSDEEAAIHAVETFMKETL